MRMRVLALSWWGLSIATAGHAQEVVPQWSVHEIVLAASGHYASPYAEAGVSATFRGPEGETKTVRGFWDGGGTFKIRFTPVRTGRWSWSTSSADAGLNGRSGFLRCTAPRRGAHGFVRRDPAHSYSFDFDDGTRYFMWGQSYYDVILNVMAHGGWKTGVDQSAAHGMNKIRLHVFAQNHYKDGIERSSYPQAIPFGGDYATPDRDRLNIAYWQGLDEYIRYLGSKGVTADLILFHPYNDNMIWGTEAQDERYVRYILARYAAFPNVTWCLANEWNYSNKPQAYFDAIGAIVRNEDPWIADGERLRALSTHQQTRIDFNFFGARWPVHAIIQYGVRNRVQDAADEFKSTSATLYENGDEWGNAGIVHNLGHDMPVVNDEYGYIGESTPVKLTQAQHRRVIWGIAAAGGYGSAGDFRMGPTGNPEISGDWLDAPEYDDVRRLTEFFTTKGLEYWKMSSRNAVKVSGTRVYVLAEPGRQYVVYAAVGGAFSLDVAAGSYRARRYNPRTGEDAALPAVNGGDSWSLTLPDENDWVVYLKAGP